MFFWKKLKRKGLLTLKNILRKTYPFLDCFTVYSLMVFYPDRAAQAVGRNRKAFFVTSGKRC